MERMTFTVPGDVKRRAQAVSEVNWSAVVSKAIQDRLDLFDRLEKFAHASKLTQKDVDELSASINRRMASRYRKALGRSSLTRTES